MSRAVAGALLAAAAALACAQPGSPPGGPVDESPPRVIETTPAAFDTLTDLDQQVIIRFDERISERLEGVTELDEAVLVSPATGVPVVDQDRRGIKVRPAGGWQPDRVYSVVILPVFRDLFGNQREAPVELVFSTGAPITESALAGFIVDRITGDVVPDARVAAARSADGERYMAVTDTAGFFAMRFVPPGTYDIQGWVDQDRDREVDFFEAQDTTDAAIAAADTVVVEMALLPMDTTAARLARAEAVDSTRVRLVFDDYFAVDSVAGTARVYILPDTTLVSDAGRLVHGARLDSILAAEAAARDSLQAIRDSLRAEEAARDSLQAIQDSLAAAQDSLAAGQDSLAAPRDAAAGDTMAAPAGAPEGADRAADEREQAPRVRPRNQRPGAPGGAARAGARATERPLPSRELILFLPAPLEPDTTYWVEVDSVVNIRGVPGGGGTAAFRTPALPDTTAADGAAADSAAVDTTGAGAAPPDTVPSEPGGSGRTRDPENRHE